MANDLVNALVGALAVTKNLSVSDSDKIAGFLRSIEDAGTEIPDLTAGIAAAMGHFNEDPDTEAGKVRSGSYDGPCPGCGSDIDDMDESDYDMMFNLYYGVRGMIDKRFMEFATFMGFVEEVPGQGEDD